LLRFENVSKSYGSRTVLQGRTGRFAPGAYGLRGPNGIGKSTLLRVLAGVDDVDGGDIAIDGHSLLAQPAAAKARLSYAPDECPVYPFVTGREMLAFVAWAKRCAISDKVTGIVERFGLVRHLDTRCGAMSLGTQKKLMLAAAWIGDPVVLLLDEPSNGLDADTRAVLVALLAAQRDTSVVFMSTHDTAFADAVGATVVEFDSLTAP
jgi:ABC-type multidrug transport system ATPase subunit